MKARKRRDIKGLIVRLENEDRCIKKSDLAKIGEVGDGGQREET